MRGGTWWVVALALLTLRAVAGPAASESSDSLYQLNAPLVAQDGRTIGLDVYRGKPVLVTMFYASCQATCPLIIETLRAIERKLPANRLKDLRVLLVSIDPERDTWEVLAATAKERRLDTTRWTVAHADERNVRLIAAALGVQYRKLPSGEFSHATQISVLDGHGKILAQSSELGHADGKLVAALNER